MKLKLKKPDCPNCTAQLEEGLQNNETEKKENSFKLSREILLIVAAVIIYTVALIFQSVLEKTPYHIAEYLFFIPVYLLTGWKVLFNAARNIIKGRIFDENFLMTLATLGAIIIHQLPEATGVMLFFKIGEFFQELSLNRSRKSIKALLEIRPDYANLKVNGSLKKVSPEEVQIGDHVVVNPGERIPLDGMVVSGNTQVDASALTGESVPRTIHEKDTVLAGMINKSGLITVEVTRLFGESSISKIMDLVENATHKKARTEQFFTRFAQYYTPAIVLAAFLTAVVPPLFITGESFSKWTYRALVMLVVSCPCALVVSIPLVYFGGIGAASRKGVLIKGSNYLDALNSLKTIVFDKTGTITKGVFRVTEVVPKNGITKEQLLRLSAEAESHSNHPIALSIREIYGKDIDPSKVQELREIEGQGIQAQVENRRVLVGNDRLLHHFDIQHETCHISGTVVHAAVDNTYAGYLVIGDEIKKDSLEAVHQLKGLGVEQLVMLTGDNRKAAETIAHKAGIDTYFAELLPEDKVKILETLINREKPGEKIAFVGDGVNDAPVLARADIGISMGSLGSDAAIETADIVIMNDSLVKIPEAIHLARKTREILIENVVFALGVKVLFIILGFLGIATMWEAVFGDMGVALLAIFNTARVLKVR
ncbi:MAG: heavy metal translocating P-type ATPase [Spirochaetota bacterium]